MAAHGLSRQLRAMPRPRPARHWRCATPLRGLRFRLNDDAIFKQVRLEKKRHTRESCHQRGRLEAPTRIISLLRDRPTPRRPRPGGTSALWIHRLSPVLRSGRLPRQQAAVGNLELSRPQHRQIALESSARRSTPALAAQGVPKTGTENYGGAIVTAGGLLFCSGTRDSKIRAFDKDTGAELWSGTLPWVGSAPPATYTKSTGVNILSPYPLATS